RIFRGKRKDVPDARYPAQLVHYPRRGEVAEFERACCTALRRQRDDHDESGRGLVDGDSLPAYLFGQALLHGPQAVLHVDLGDVDVGARIEGDGDGRAAVRAARGRHIEKAIDAVQLLLDDLRDVRFERGRVGARI